MKLCKRDVDLNEGISVIAGCKIKSAVFIPMHQKLRDVFNLIKVVPMRDDDLWFPDFRGDTVGVAISRGFKKAGIGWVSFHHFCHFGACHIDQQWGRYFRCKPMVGAQRYSHNDDLCPCQS